MSVREFACKGQDEADLLALDGPLIEVQITAPLMLVEFLRRRRLPDFPIARGLAQIDTGAQVSAVDRATFAALGIPAVNAELIQTAHRLSELDRYNASVRFPQLGGPARPLNLVLGGHFERQSYSGANVLMLMGRDLLRSWRFSCNGPTSSFSVET